MKGSVSPPIWKLNLTTPAIRHNVWQLQQIGQTIAKVFHFCPLFVSLNTSLSGNLHTFSSPFQRYPTCLISVRACCWSTVLWTARRTWRRRPGRSLTLGCINSVGTSLVFFSRLFSPSKVSSTTNSHVLNVVTYVGNMEKKGTAFGAGNL